MPKWLKNPEGYTQICVFLVFDMNQGDIRKSRLVSGGHTTGPNTDTYYSSVVSLNSVFIFILLDEINSI